MVKPVITGYLDRKGRPVDPSICTSYIANFGPNTPGVTSTDGLLWSYLMEPSSQATALGLLGDELDYAQANGLKVKLRTFNPQPASLNALSPPVSHNGSGIVPTDPPCAGQQFDPAGFAIPNTRFWHDSDYIAAYADFQATLAANFDTHPALGDVAFGGGCVPPYDSDHPAVNNSFAEPMIRVTSDVNMKRAQWDTWVAAGSPYGQYEDSDIAALKALMDCHTVWSETPQSLACNPHQTVRLGAPCAGLTRYSAHISNARTAVLNEYWCSVMGPLAVIGNNSIRPNDPGGVTGPDTYAAMYDQMVALCNATGATMYFQTAGNTQLDDELIANGGTYPTWDDVFVATIDKCLGYGANYIELPSNYADPGITIPPFPSTVPVAVSAAPVSSAITVTTPRIAVPTPTPRSVGMAVGDARPKVQSGSVSTGLHVGTAGVLGGTVLARDFNGNGLSSSSRLYRTTGLPALSADFVVSGWVWCDSTGENALGIPLVVQDSANNILVALQTIGGVQGSATGLTAEPLLYPIVGYTTTAAYQKPNARSRARWAFYLFWLSGTTLRFWVGSQTEELQGESHYATGAAGVVAGVGTRRVGTSSTNKVMLGDSVADNRAFDGRMAQIKMCHGASWTGAQVLAYGRAMQQSWSGTSTPGSTGSTIFAYQLNGTSTAAGVVETDDSGNGLDLSTDATRAPASVSGPTPSPVFRSRAIHFDVISPAEWTMYSARANPTGRTITLMGTIDTSYDTATSVEARMRGDTTWQTVASPVTGGSWSGSFAMRLDGSAQIGSGIEVRVNWSGHAAETETWWIGLGDLFIVAGQSNAVGQGGNPNDLYGTADDQGNTIYSGPQKAHLLTNYSVSGVHQWGRFSDPIDAQRAEANAEMPTRIRWDTGTVNWVEDTEATMDSTDTDYYSTGAGASAWPIVAAWWMQWTGRPFGALPVSRGGMGITSFEPAVSNFSTLYTSSPAPQIHEELAQRLQQICGIANGTTALTDPSMAPIRTQGRCVFWLQGESDAINHAADTYSVTQAAFDTPFDGVMDDFADDFGMDVMVGIIGQISTADTNDEAPIAVRQYMQSRWGHSTGASGQNLIRRGPVLYDLALETGGGFLHFRYDDSTVTLRTMAKRWALCLYDAYIASDSDAHRGPRLVSFTGSGTTYVALFDRPLDAQASGYDGIMIRDGSTLRTWVASAPSSVQYTAVRDATNTAKVNITLGASPSGTINITMGEINSTNGRRVPMVTHTANGLTVAVPAEVVYRQNASSNVVLSPIPVSGVITMGVTTPSVSIGTNATAAATPVPVGMAVNSPTVTISADATATPVSAAMHVTTPVAAAPDSSASATPVSAATHVTTPTITISETLDASPVNFAMGVVTPSVSVLSVLPVAVIGPLVPTVVPATVHFDGSASTGLVPLTYAWDFGDGGTGSGVSPSHTYTTAGDYVVVLTVTQTTGQTDVDSAIMRVRPPEFTPGEPGEGSMIDVVRITATTTETLIWDGGTGLGETALNRVSSENDQTFTYVFRNKGAGIVYIGPKGKTTSALGFPVAVNAEFSFHAGFADKIYATSASTSALEILVGST